MASDLDIRPRRIWVALNVPGKIMMRLLESRDRLLAGQSLADLYRDQAHVALYSAALALYWLPRHGESKKTRYSEVLADIRDFLRFRFRAKTAPDINRAWKGYDEIVSNVTDKELVDHVIGSLDGLCRRFSDDHSATMTELLATMRYLRDLLKNAARRVFPGEPEDYTQYEVVFAEAPDN
jgi:hypothetical protein